MRARRQWRTRWGRPFFTLSGWLWQVGPRLPDPCVPFFSLVPKGQAVPARSFGGAPLLVTDGWRCSSPAPICLKGSGILVQILVFCDLFEECFAVFAKGVCAITSFSFTNTSCTVVSMAPKRSTRRRAIKEKCIMNSLPTELIEQVFLKLPACCLLRCIGVCKMWRIIIRDSQFAMAHLHHVPPYTLVFSPKRSTSGKLWPSDAVIIDKAWSPSTFAAPVIGPDDLLCGTCNGLLCLHTPTSTLKIANLATGECLHLKKPTKSLKDDHFSFYRFGFHPVTKEYKVIHFCQEIRPLIEGTFNVIQIYALGDEKWKDIITPEALSLNCIKNSGVVIVDGTMYWLIEDGGSNWKHAIMSFDLEEESFAQIQLPAVDLEDWAFGDGRNYWVTEINRKVCVSSAHCLDGVLIGKLQVWALNGTVDQRWSQLYSIQLSSSFARGLHFVYGDKILIQHHDSNLYSYELLGKNFEIESSKMVKLLGLSPSDLQFYTCVKSLVRLDLYAKAAVVRIPKRQGGWKLKKWKSWLRDFNIEKMWRNAYQFDERCMQEVAQNMRIKYKEIAQNLPNELILPCVSMEIDRILQNMLDCRVQRPSPTTARRLNWVGWLDNLKKLEMYIHEIKNDILKVLEQVNDDIASMFKREYSQYGR